MADTYPKTFAPAFELRALPDAAPEAATPWSHKIWLGLFMLAAMAISLFFLSSQSLRLDESQSIWQSSHTVGGVFYTIAQDVHVPLYGLLLHFWIFLFGDSVSVLRAMSLVFFLASIPAVYALGRLAYSRQVGLLAAALTAVSPFLNWYGNEIRMYSLMVLLAVLNHYFFLSIYKKGLNASKSDMARWWLGYAATAFLGIYTHYLFWFILASQAIFYFAYSRQFRPGTFPRLTLIAVLLGLTMAPWVYYVFHTVNMISNSEPQLARPHVIDIFNTFSQFMFGFQDDHLNTLIISLWPLSVVMAFLGLRKKVRIPAESVYFLVGVFFPILAIFAISVAWKPLFLSRYLIFSTPALYLFLMWLVSTYPIKIQRAVAFLFIGGMAATLAVQIYKPDTPVKEDYRDVSSYISQTAAPQDVVVISSPFTIYPIEYYYNGAATLTTLPIWNRDTVGAIPPYSSQELASDTNIIQAGHDEAYVVLSYDQGYQQDIKNYFDAHFPLVAHKNFSPNLDVYVYKLGGYGIAANN